MTRFMMSIINGFLWIIPVWAFATLIGVEVTVKIVVLCVASEIFARLADRVTDHKGDKKDEEGRSGEVD